MDHYLKGSDSALLSFLNLMGYRQVPQSCYRMKSIHGIAFRYPNP